jgi:hypothetical protein
MTEGLASSIGEEVGRPVQKRIVKVVKRKATAHNRRYSAAFKRLSPRFKTKSGKWMKNGFKRAVKAAHKEARR